MTHTHTFRNTEINCAILLINELQYGFFSQNTLGQLVLM